MIKSNEHFIVLDIEQGSKEWLAVRKSYIGGSDAGIVMDASPYTTPFQLWQDKLSLILDKEVTPNMMAGKKVEPIVRAEIANELGIDFDNPVIVSKSVPFMLASLDGIDESCKIIMEIKLVGQELYDKIMKTNQIPEHHMYQIQHNLRVSMAEYCLYVVTSRDGEHYTLRIEPNQNIIDELIKNEEEFYNDTNRAIPPKLTDRDYIDRSGLEHWIYNANEYKRLDGIEKECKKKKDELKENFFLPKCDGHSSEGGGLKIHTIYKKPPLEYSKIPEVQALDLSKYQKPMQAYWTVRIVD